MQFLKNLYDDSLIRNAVYLITTNFSNLPLGSVLWVVATRYYNFDKSFIEITGF